jgi:hypothetical protein
VIACINVTLRADLECWIPEPQRVKFAADLDSLQRVHGLTDADIAEQVAEVLAVHAENMKNPTFLLYIERGRSVVAGEPVNDQVARRERKIQFLAMIVHAVRLGPERGLALLTDAGLAGQVIHGKKFPGRKPGSYASWKKWIERKLKKDNALKPAALWELFKAKPLRGWRAVESAKIGQYLESPTCSDDDVTYKRFQDAVSEVRRDLKKG